MGYQPEDEQRDYGRRSLIPPDHDEDSPMMNGWLVLVLLVVAGCGYLALFTDLFRGPSSVRYSINQPPAPRTALPAPVSPQPTVAKTAPEKPVAAPEKPMAATPAPAVAVAPKPRPVKATAAPARLWRVVVGSYWSAETVASVTARIREAGFKPVVVSHPPRGVLFYRLQYRQISDPAEAAQALAALKKQAATAFSERNGAVESLYISSHRARSGALADQKLLAARGLKTTLVESRVVLAQRDIRIDGLRHADAVNAVAALKKRGLDPRLSRP